MQNMFGEGGDIDKHIYKYDPDNNQLTSIKIDAPKFITHLMYEGDTEIVLDDYNYFWLKVRDGIMSYEEIEELRKLPNVRLDIIPREISKIRAKIESDFPMPQIAKEYCNYKNETDETLGYGLKIIRDVDSNIEEEK